MSVAIILPRKSIEKRKRKKIKRGCVNWGDIISPSRKGNIMADIIDLNNKLNYEEKQLLMHSVNIYLEKLHFVIKNGQYYNVSNFVIKSLKVDCEKLLILREKLFSVEVEKID